MLPLGTGRTLRARTGDWPQPVSLPLQHGWHGEGCKWEVRVALTSQDKLPTASSLCVLVYGMGVKMVSGARVCLLPLDLHAPRRAWHLL